MHKPLFLLACVGLWASCGAETPAGKKPLAESPDLSEDDAGSDDGSDAPGDDGVPGDGDDSVDTQGLPCDVHEVLANRCVECHADGPGPMKLDSWDALQANGKVTTDKKVYELVAQRIHDDASPMPPSPN